MSGNEVTALPRVRDDMSRFLSGPGFSCVAGKTAWQRGTAVHGHYTELGDAHTAPQLYRDLCAFALDKDHIDELFASFVATFEAPSDADEEEFEEQLWHQLQLLHDIDSTMYPWAPSVNPDPESDHFAYSVAGHPFFVVGLHPDASRLTRRSPWPAVVFNSHVQFQRLRARGSYEQLKNEIRRREISLQGSLNPNLADFGQSTEARQYSGRAVPDAWHCPLRVSVTIADSASARAHAARETFHETTNEADDPGD